MLPLNAATLKLVALIGAEWFVARRSCASVGQGR